MLRVLGVLLIVQIVFSLWPIFVKIAIEAGVDAIMISFTRDLTASLLLWIGVWLESGRQNIFTIVSYVLTTPIKMYYVEKHERSLFIFLGICSSVNSVGYVIALRYVTPFNSALLHPTIPVFAATLGAIYGVEKLTFRKILGTLMCVVGSVVVVLSQADLSLNSSLIGNICLVLQSFAMAALLVGQMFVPTRHSSLKITAIYYTVGTLISAPISLTVLSTTSGFGNLGLKSVGVVAFGALFVIAFNYAALTWANKKSSPSVPATSMMLQPPLTFMLGYLIGERPSASWWEIGGGGAIIAGLILSVMPANSTDGAGTVGLDERGSGLQNDYDPIYTDDDALAKASISHSHSLMLSDMGEADGYVSQKYRSMQTAPPLTKRSGNPWSTSYAAPMLSPVGDSNAPSHSISSATSNNVDDELSLLLHSGESLELSEDEL